MKVGLMGFGKAGKAAASVLLHAKEICLEWVVRRDSLPQHHAIQEFLGLESKDPGRLYSSQHLTAEELVRMHPVDVIIDFSSAEGIDYYADVAKEHCIKVVSAISHYSDREIAILDDIAEHTAVLWSPNITVGVNYMILAAKVLQNIAPNIDIEIIEEHFKRKPELSGTAARIAESLGKEVDDVKSIRAGGIVGKHEVIFGFPYQVVRLTHESISREAFGNGAIFASKHLIDKPPGRYAMDELMLPYFNVGMGSAENFCSCTTCQTPQPSTVWTQ
ncbi:MAG: dihydrodipicolinate reductase [Oxalobacter sp.]|nr:MAG: dihydrodipicolinate reductase [Oxalobacter sp.]